MSNNLRSALDNPKVISEKLNIELVKGRIAGPFQEIPLKIVRISPIGLVPKTQPGTFRIIHYLSHPEKGSGQFHSAAYRCKQIFVLTIAAKFA